jgi:hypothetical protein
VYAAVRLTRGEERALEASAPPPAEPQAPTVVARAPAAPNRRRLAAAAVGTALFAVSGLAAGAERLSGDASGAAEPTPAAQRSALPAFFGPPEEQPRARRRLLLRTKVTRRPNRASSPLAVSLPMRRSVFEQLQAGSARHDADWSLVLAFVHTSGGGVSWASPGRLDRLERGFAALRGRRPRRAALQALTGDPDLVDRTLALSRYYQAVGPDALVTGLGATSLELGRRVLGDQRVQIYPGGRSDIASGRVDVRVLASIEYLAAIYGRITVTCLISGHKRFARPNVVSAHVYGRAVDIAALGGVGVYGHQRPGGITDRAIRNLMLLPAGARPSQIISLLDRGGPSFALENHADHIHIGF